jgi:hypothetical protein
MADAPQIDYDALADQARRQAATPVAPAANVDYDKLDQLARQQSQAQPAGGAPAYADLKGNPIERFGQGLWSTTGAALGSAGKALWDLMNVAGGDKKSLDPETKQLWHGIIQSHQDQAQKAKDAWDQGNHTEAAGHALATILPLIGPAAAHAAERVGGSAPVFDKYGNVIQPGQQPDVAGGLGETTGILGPSAVAAAVPKIVGGLKVEPTLTPAGASAVQFADTEGIPISAATRTGNETLRRAQATTARTPSGSRIATKAQAATQAGLASTAADIAGLPLDALESPEAAGAGTAKSLSTTEATHGAGADKAYQQLRDIEADPANHQTITTGMRSVDSGLVDAQGNPIIHQEPITETIALPVDMTSVKQALAPLHDEFAQDMPLTQRQSSAGLNAMRNVLDGPDVVSGSVADRNLGAIKAILRENVNGRTKFMLGKVLDAMDPVVDQAVGQGGQQALDALHEGRSLTKARYATKATIKALPDEPVGIFKTLTTPGDARINLLRDVQTHAPNSLPALGRATLEGLFNTALGPDGKPNPAAALKLWNKMGDSTKSILFPQQIDRLNDFFQLGKLDAQTPRMAPVSSSVHTVGNMAALPAELGLFATGHPAVAGTALGVQALYGLGSRALARALWSPKVGKFLTNPRVPAPPPGVTFLPGAAAGPSEPLLRAKGGPISEPLRQLEERALGRDAALAHLKRG